MNSLFNKLKPAPAPIPNNPMQLMGKFRQDPIGILKSIGYNIPDGMQNPQQIVQHLVTSGQVVPGRIQQIQNMLGNFIPK